MLLLACIRFQNIDAEYSISERQERHARDREGEHFHEVTSAISRERMSF